MLDSNSIDKAKMLINEIRLYADAVTKELNNQKPYSYYILDKLSEMSTDLKIVKSIVRED